MKYHLLIVEDNQNEANALDLTLQELGYQTTIAHDHDTALLALNQDIRFDLVLLDYLLMKGNYKEMWREKIAGGGERCAVYTAPKS